ncbi:MAG: acyl-ACP--UDP-N-acetylglucosamine O-acyltransferase [Acidobacteriota bacterium]
MAIHASAVVDPTARLGDGVAVGPFSVVGADVEIGAGSIIDSHAVIGGPTVIGERCHVFPFASIGLGPQDLKFKGEPTRLLCGSDNIFREFVTVHRGTVGGGGVTSIGSRNLFMAYAHIAHDCQIGSDTIFANAATLAGHVTVGDFATVGASSGVHQFCRVGNHAFIGGYSVVVKDALPYMKSVGNHARVFGVNTIGLERRGFGKDAIAAIKKAYRILFQSKLNTSGAVARMREELADSTEVRYLVEFIESSERGVVKR